MYFNWNDTVNLFSKLTPHRLLNAAKVMTSYQLSKLTGKPVQWGYPVSVSFEPTTSCNLRCPECPSGLREFTRPTGMLKKNFFEQTIDEIYKDTSTNAHYLTDEKARKTVESGLERLIISIDGTTQEVYQQYRIGGKLEKVLQGARNIVKYKKEMKSKTPFVIFQFLVVKPNEHQIEDIKQLTKEIGVDDVWFKTAQVYDYENDPHQLIPSNEKYSRYKKVNGNYQLK